MLVGLAERMTSLIPTRAGRRLPTLRRCAEEIVAVTSVLPKTNAGEEAALARLGRDGRGFLVLRYWKKRALYKLNDSYTGRGLSSGPR